MEIERITPIYVYTLVCGAMPCVCHIVTERNKHFLSMLGIDFRVIRFEPEEKLSVALTSDRIRLEKASKEKRILYVDWDCLIIDMPPLSNGTAFGEYNKKYIDTFFMWNGDQTEIFAKFLGECGQTQNISGWYYPKINECFKRFTKCNQVIGSDFIKHYGTGKGRQ
jgi:hypothetical protein